MNESKNNDSSRRDFIKTSAKIALGSTLVGGVAPQAGSQPNPPPGPGKPAPHPGKLQKYFAGQMKLPGWVPDPPQSDGTYLFPEEAINKYPYGFDAFVPPNDKNPFENAVLILGAPFDKDPKLYTAFEKLLADIAQRARYYNATLYWMRRLDIHLRAKLDQSFVIHTPPPRNPHGDLDQDKDPSNKDVSIWDKEFGKEDDPPNQPSRTAEKNWGKAAGELATILTPPQTAEGRDAAGQKEIKTFDPIWADMIQVNGYIVSIRLVADFTTSPTHGKSIFEMGGSSSHISLSSAFSSP